MGTITTVAGPAQNGARPCLKWENVAPRCAGSHAADANNEMSKEGCRPSDCHDSPLVLAASPGPRFPQQVVWKETDRWISCQGQRGGSAATDGPGAKTAFDRREFDGGSLYFPEAQ